MKIDNDKGLKVFWKL